MSANSSINFDDTDIFRGTLVVLSALSLGVFIITQAVNGTTERAASAAAEQDQVAAAEAETSESVLSPQTTLKSAGAASNPKAPSVAESGAPVLENLPARNLSTSAISPSTTFSAPSTTVKPRETSEYVVSVLNGARVGGIARKVNDALHAKSFVTSFPGNTRLPVGESTILYLQGYEQEAKAVAEALGVSDSLVSLLDDTNRPVNTIGDANVIVVIGQDGKIAF